MNNNMPWWKKTVFYQIYMPSFLDGNGDGIGDFKGITSKLSYLAELGIGGIWLTPFYPSPKVDNGYDISDYYNIDPDYGTMEDFEEFIRTAHKYNIKVIADMVVNHTSSEHAWFKESRESKDSAKRDWYIWRENIPNNWESFFGGSAWEYDESTKQYYYHSFAKEQVDLNWANPEVRKAVYDVFDFWIKKGIDGFRLDVINNLTISSELKDNPYDENGKQIHQYDVNQEGIIEVMKDLRSLMNQYDEQFLVGEISSDDLDVIYGYAGEDKLHTTFNFNLGSRDEFKLEDIFCEIEKMSKLYQTSMPTLFFGSHDMGRSRSRFSFNEQEVKLLATFMLTFRGIPFIYFGEEIGMKSREYHSIEDAKDIQGVMAYRMAIEAGKSKEEALACLTKEGRDKSRGVMQWNNTKNAGFSKVEPWLPLSDSVDQEFNVMSQMAKEDSIYAYYKKLIALRNQEEALSFGTCEDLKLVDKVISYKRSAGDKEMVIAINFGEEQTDWKSLGVEPKEILLTSDREIDALDVNKIAGKQAVIALL